MKVGKSEMKEFCKRILELATLLNDPYPLIPRERIMFAQLRAGRMDHFNVSYNEEFGWDVWYHPRGVNVTFESFEEVLGYIKEILKDEQDSINTRTTH